MEGLQSQVKQLRVNPADVPATDLQPSKDSESHTGLFSDKRLDNKVSDKILRKRSFPVTLTTPNPRKSARISQIDSASSKKPTTSDPAGRLLFRLRGFREIYNPALPLKELESFYNRRQFSTTVSGLNYDSDLIRKASMRAVWNLSQEELLGGIVKHGYRKVGES